MNSVYFLGANSKDGFYSLYGGFCCAPGDYLTVIKGGPGTGKSGFMRKIGRAAEARGLDVEYVLCSGDPDSLDGVYIPALHRGWVDGTAPHVIEPGHFGIDGDYVNLGVFYRTGLSDEHRDYVNQLYDRYRGEYAAAYSYLSACEKLRSAYMPRLFGTDECGSLQRRLRNILKRCRPRDDAADTGAAHCRERFLHALSCKGELYLSEEVTKLCKLIYQLDGGLGGADDALKIAAEEAKAMGAAVIVCRCPAAPERYDAVLIPGWGAGFVSDGYGIPGARHIRLDAAVDSAALQPHRAAIREGRQIEEKLRALALERLAQAKILHDTLEEYSKAQMNLPALTEYTARYIEDIFEHA